MSDGESLKGTTMTKGFIRTSFVSKMTGNKKFQNKNY